MEKNLLIFFSLIISVCSYAQTNLPVLEEFDSNPVGNQFGLFQFNCYNNGNNPSDPEYASFSFSKDTGNRLSGQNSAVLHIDHPGSEWWAIQIRLEQLALQNGDRLEVSYLIEADEELSFRNTLEGTSNSQYHYVLLPANQKVRVNYVTDSWDSSSSQNNFILGLGNCCNGSCTVWIDSLSIKKKSEFSEGFTNPISPYQPVDFADPGVVFHEGYYYAARPASYGSQIVVFKASKLEELYRGTGTLVWTAPSGTDHSEAIWAPYLQRVNGEWYIYYTATHSGVIGWHRMFAIKTNTSDPLGSYSDYGSVYAPNTDFYAIDGKVIQKPSDGSLYFVWSGGLPNQDIYIAPMDNPTHICGNAVKISGNVASWENRVHEAPEFLFKNGKSIIVYSTGKLLMSGPSGYKMGTLTNTDGNYLNPSSWVKSSGPVFQYWSGDLGEVVAPGSCSVIKSPDNEEDWIIYQAKHTASNHVYDREIRAQKFTWNANGDPLFEHPIPSGVSQAVPSGELTLPLEINSGSTYVIMAKHSGKVLTVQNNSMNTGALIEQREYNDSDNQKWEISLIGNGYYKIISSSSGLALNVSAYSLENGASIIQQVYTGYNDELWRIASLGNGYYELIAKHSQKVLDVSGASMNNGASLVQWPFLGENNQSWQLIELPSLKSAKLMKVQPVTNLNKIKVYPNPASNRITVEIPKNSGRSIIILTDLNGKSVYKKEISKDSDRNITIYTANWSGVYLLTLETNNQLFREKVLINN